MIGMHDRRTNGQFGQIAQHRLGLAHRELAPPRLLRALAVELALGEDGERRFGEGETIVEWGDGYRKFATLSPCGRGLGRGDGAVGARFAGVTLSQALPIEEEGSSATKSCH